MTLRNVKFRPFSCYFFYFMLKFLPQNRTVEHSRAILILRLPCSV